MTPSHKVAIHLTDAQRQAIHLYRRRPRETQKSLSYN